MEKIMSEQENKTFSTPALVELLGRQQIAGMVSEQVIAGSGFVRVDVPETSRRPAYTRFFGTSAIYSITPVDESVMTRLAAQIYTPDIVPLTAPVRQLDVADHDEIDEENDDEDNPF
jgi:hypothetical protein